MRQINRIAISKFTGKIREYRSIDEVKDKQNVCTYTTEYLNGLEVNGLPEHVLSLKIGAPVMILRNYDPLNGICNGTKGLISRMQRNVIEIIVSDVNDEPKHVLIHRWDLSPTDAQLGVKFTRHQFPISLAFGMTINKSQGQTLNRVGIYLPEPVFGHGQLYVAMSRVTHPNNLKILILNTEQQGNLQSDSKKIFTKNVVFYEILASAGIINKSLTKSDNQSKLNKVLSYICADDDQKDETESEWIDDPPIDAI